MKVLVVDDDRDLVDIVQFALRRAGYEVLPAYDSPTALKHLEKSQPDLAMVDINMGCWNGFELLKDLRRQSKIPVIMVSARADEQDKVLGLDLGADDYVVKPFSHSELLARIRAHIRRSTEHDVAPERVNGELRVGPLVLNTAEHTAQKDGKALALTVTEYRLLQYLMINAGRVVPSHSIAKHVWGYDDASTTEIVRVAVYRLRRKLEEDPTKPKLLHTVPGVGIILKPES